ncbi:MAG: hypothetical protein K1060chlam2_00752 [Chlamydiae bacterium]|nr:hypothetical protein [Chlamydiota bacterium]
MSTPRTLALVLLGLIFTTLFYGILSHIEQRKPSPSSIRWIAQTGPIREGLKTDYLAELLHLSIDHPTSLDPEEAEKILIQSPLIKEVAVTLLAPETLLIDYTLRRPSFFLSDFSNVAIDERGKIFPIAPFSTPKRLPELFLGLKKIPDWSDPIPEQKLRLAFHLTEQFRGSIRIASIDLSQSDRETLGRREIVLILDNENGNEHYLRLTPKSYVEELSHYFAIREQLLTKSLVIDLRVPALAFLNQFEKTE